MRPLPDIIEVFKGFSTVTGNGQDTWEGYGLHLK